MINVYIYVDDKIPPEEVVNELLKKRLIANASIDIDNNYFELVNESVQKKVHVVITAQTKALLFSKITEVIEQKWGDKVPIFATPLVSANSLFDAFIRESTTKV